MAMAFDSSLRSVSSKSSEPSFRRTHFKTQAILQHRSKKGQSACRSPAHLSKGGLSPAVTFALLRAVNGIRAIFDKSTASGRDDGSPPFPFARQQRTFRP